ncbi:Retrotransposon protein, Ty3-gypsy subclass [Phytophthora megakarya]|uniref:Retrotransposon protein, Ty3-gypsy subclass n=1 Tax=Phytophthora megakarya TaxID=4795 RepID=A0A225VXG9_9STRA|nr:Retrotransposon protein, Ty3-gypsy subclass [Phytophthora megakarya]
MRECVATYFDDIYVFTKTNNVEEHLVVVRRLFAQKQFRVLKTLSGVKEFELTLITPTVYVQRFCQHFSEISSPLFEMVKRKDRKQLDWTPELARAFEVLKTALSQAPVLALPDFTKPFLLRIDARWGAPTNYSAKDGTQATEKPIAYCGRKMNSAKLNYPTHEQEMLANVRCLKIRTVYLLNGDGSSLALEGTHPEDNKQKDLSLVRPASRNSTTISTHSWRNERRCRHRPDFEVAFLKQKHKQMLVVRRLNPATMTTLIRRAQNRAGFTKEFVDLKEIEAPGTFVFDGKDGSVLFQMRDQLKLFIPSEDIEIPNTILWELHDIAPAGHPGIQKPQMQYWRTLGTFAPRPRRKWVFVKKLQKPVRDYVSTCESCLRNKSRLGKPPRFLHPLEVPAARWASIGIDIMTGLPLTATEHDAIMVIADRLTKGAQFIAIKGKISTKELASLFIEHFIRVHGLPVDVTYEIHVKILELVCKDTRDEAEARNGAPSTDRRASKANKRDLVKLSTTLCKRAPKRLG